MTTVRNADDHLNPWWRYTWTKDGALSSVERIADLDDPDDMRAGAALEIAALEALPKLLDDAERLALLDRFMAEHGETLADALSFAIVQQRPGAQRAILELSALLATVPALDEQEKAR